MKKIIASITMLAAGAALASTVSSDQTFGVLKITSDTAETAISVPWVAAGSGSSAETIKVVDFVKTSNLHTGDRLLKYDAELDEGNGGFYCWALTADAGSWQASNTAYHEVFISSGSLTETLTRGDAIILVRGQDSLDETDHAIYLYGQYKAAPASYLIPRSAGRKTLFAPINVSGGTLDLNSDITWTNAEDGDMIQLQSVTDGKIRTFTYDSSQKGSEWGRQGISGWVTASTEIKAGQGAWYITTSGSGGNVTATLK